MHEFASDGLRKPISFKCCDGIDLESVIVEPSPPQIDFALERGRSSGSECRHLRLLSSAGNSYNKNYRVEIDGAQRPMLNVFHREDSVMRHFWGSELLFAPTEPGQDMRHTGTLEPLWNMLDLTSEGRGTGWDEQFQYGCCATRRA
jgi:predicted dithiol-disulfide oxidoreductase (DUF899 family)